MTAKGDGEIGRHPAYVGTMLSLCALAVFLNFLVIFAVVKFGRYRASIDIFLTNLAASDILHAGIVNPVHVKNTQSYNKDFYGDAVTCKIIMFIPLLSVMSAILTIVAIAIDRYRVIVSQKQLYRRGAITAIICIWITAFVVSAPQLYEYNIYHAADEENPNTTRRSCGSEGIVENFEAIYAAFVIVFAFLVPLIVLTACYYKLVSYVWKHGKRFRMTKMKSTRTDDRNDTATSSLPADDRVSNMLSSRMIKILKMLIWITVTFILLWTPYFVLFGMTEITGIDDTSNLFEWPHVVGRMMTVLSTISNPTLYLVFSETFRQAIINAFLCRPQNHLLGQSTQCTRSNRVHPDQEHGASTCHESKVQVNFVPLKNYR